MTNKSDPHTAWLNEWRSEQERFESAEGDSGQGHSDRAWQLSAKLANTPATTSEGLRAQLEWFKADLGYYVTTMVGDDLNSCIDTMLESASKIVQSGAAASQAS